MTIAILSALAVLAMILGSCICSASTKDDDIVIGIAILIVSLILAFAAGGAAA